MRSKSFRKNFIVSLCNSFILNNYNFVLYYSPSLGKTERFLEDLVRLVNISGNGQVLDLSVLADLDEKSSDEDNNSDGSTSDKNLPKYTPTDAGSDPGAKNRTAGEDDPDLKEGIASSVVGGNSASLNVRISKFNILLFVSSIVSFLQICNLAWT